MSDLSTGDESQDLCKFTKFLALKSAQIIVQSRLGEKVRTQCKPVPDSNKDWFHVAIDDLPEVLEKAKNAMCHAGPTTLPLPLCVDIYLCTAEGDKMVLETWCIGVNSEVQDHSVKVAYTVYHRMGLLLKSLVSVTRVTPAYKLSRRQSVDSYLISYNIYVGEPQFHKLGEGYSQARIGQLGTPGGSIHVTCYFRTKMTLSPQPSKDVSIMLKSDHFRPEFSPKHLSNISDDNIDPFSKPMKVGAFVDPERNIRTVPPEDDYPFADLMKLSKTRANYRNKSPTPPRPLTPEKEDTDNGNVSQVSQSSTSREEFILLQAVKAPFASPTPITELGQFYRECHGAPELEGSSSVSTVAEQVGDLTQQLAQFEVSLKEYDNVIMEFCSTDNNN